MILGMNQPYFFPYLGYFQLMNMADVYILYDDVNFIKNGWIHRNRIKINQAPAYVNIKIKKASQNKKINELELSMTENDFQLLMAKIKNTYSKAPYKDETLALLEDIFSCGETNLAKFLAYSLRKTAEYMGIETPIYSATELALDHTNHGEQRVIDVCKHVKCDTYINAIGGIDLYNRDDFKQEGITIAFLKMDDDVVYPQGKGDFIPELSILDVLMYNSKEEIQKLLTRYTIV